MQRGLQQDNSCSMRSKLTTTTIMEESGRQWARTFLPNSWIEDGERL